MPALDEIPPRCTCEELAGEGVVLAEACIAHLWIFERLKPREVRALLDVAWRRKCEVGEPIFHQGDPAQVMFLVKGGRIKLTKSTEEGRELILDIRKAGDIVGETMLSEETTYPVTARCLEDTLLCGFTRDRFRSLILTYPNIGLQVISNLSSRVSWLTDRVGSMSESRLEDRLYEVLSTVAKEHGTRTERGFALPFALTHEELGFLSGAHRVSVTRAMKTLRESGRVVQEGKTLVLTGRG